MPTLAVASMPTALPPATDEPRPSVDRVLARFAPALGADPSDETPAHCAGVRALVVVRAEDEETSLVALDVGGQRMVRRRGMAAGDMTVAWVGVDRAWLARADGVTCEARVFAPPVSVSAVAKKPVSVQGVVRLSANEVHVDRAALETFLEDPRELSKIRIAPDATGIRIMKVPPSSILGVLGIEEGDRLSKAGGIELTSPEKIMELFARLRTFERLSVVVERKGKPVTMDYVIE